jgi:molybdate transport system substrate-binding protein
MRLLLSCIVLAAAASLVPGARADDVFVFAAASLKDALDDSIGAYRAGGAVDRIVASYAASSTLARQIDAGAPAGVFVSADTDWMDYLERRGHLEAGSRRNLAGNRLVLIAPADSRASLEITRGFPLAARLGKGRLAMANPDAVPAGKYGKAALESLGVWDDVRSKVVAADNVRAAMVLVSRGEAPLGIVYRTDALADSAVRIVATFPESTHPPIVYPLAVTARGGRPARAFAAWLLGPRARAVFERHGFLP